MVYITPWSAHILPYGHYVLPFLHKKDAFLQVGHLSQTYDDHERNQGRYDSRPSTAVSNGLSMAIWPIISYSSVGSASKKTKIRGGGRHAEVLQSSILSDPFHLPLSR